jgi:hypothetical protein
MRDLAHVAHARGFDLVVVLPPRIHPTPSRLRIEAEYMAYVARLGVPVMDYRDLPFLSDKHYFDASHLNRDGAHMLSRRLASDLSTLHAGVVHDATFPAAPHAPAPSPLTYRRVAAVQ